MVRNWAACPLTWVKDPPTYTVWSFGPGRTEYTCPLMAGRNVVLTVPVVALNAAMFGCETPPIEVKVPPITIVWPTSASDQTAPLSTCGVIADGTALGRPPALGAGTEA